MPSFLLRYASMGGMSAILKRGVSSALKESFTLNLLKNPSLWVWKLTGGAFRLNGLPILTTCILPSLWGQMASCTGVLKTPVLQPSTPLIPLWQIIPSGGSIKSFPLPYSVSSFWKGKSWPGFKMRSKTMM